MRRRQTQQRQPAWKKEEDGEALPPARPKKMPRGVTAASILASSVPTTAPRASDALADVLRRRRGVQTASSSSSACAADEMKPSTTAGHPKCFYSGLGNESECSGNKKSRIVQHVFPCGKLGDIYCQECWKHVTSQEGKEDLKCQLLGHPRRTQNLPDEGWSASGGDVEHLCIGTEADDLVQHVHKGEQLDLYCMKCWNEFKEDPAYVNLLDVPCVAPSAHLARAGIAFECV